MSNLSSPCATATALTAALHPDDGEVRRGGGAVALHRFGLSLLSLRAIILQVNAKHRKTLAAIFVRPTLASIPFTEIEALFKALGGTVTVRKGSRVSIELKGEQWRCHRPHPGKEAKRYQVEEARELLERIGVRP